MAYLNVQGAYFDNAGGKLTPVNDPNILKGLQGGTIASTKQTGLGTATVAIPNLNAQPLPYTPAPAIPATGLGEPTAPYTVPAYTAPAVPSVEQLMKDYSAQTPAESSLQVQQNDILSGIESLLTKSGTESARKGELEIQAGVPDLSKQLNEINAQIRNLTGQAFSAQQVSEGRLAPTFAITGEQAQIQRQLSAQTFGLAAASEALQGNIALANDNVQRALDSEFGGLESQLKYQQLLLDLNRDKLSSEEKKKADTLQIQLSERQNTIDQQKADRKSVYDMVVSAIQQATQAGQTVPNTVIQQAYASTPEGALSLLAPYLGAQAPAEPTKLQFVAGTANQPSGYFNPATGKFTPTGGGGAPSEPSPYKSELATNGINAVDGLLTIAKRSPGIFGKTAAAPIPGFLRSDDYRNYSAQLDYLKGNIIPAALSAMREASKTGGALGQVSDREGAWLASSLGALSMSQSSEAVVKQLGLVKQHLDTWRTAVEQYGGGSSGGEPIGDFVTAPDGTQIEIVD